MNLSFRQLTPDTVAPAYQIIKQCGEDMFQRFGLCHWHPPIPLESLIQITHRKNVYGVFDGEDILATFTVGVGAGKHTQSFWRHPGMPGLYLNKLAVRPDLQNQGIGTWCLQQVERLATENQCKVVRFNIVTAHERLLVFFQQQGYEPRGNLWIKDWRGVSREITLMEKEISRDPRELASNLGSSLDLGTSRGHEVGSSTKA